MNCFLLISLNDEIISDKYSLIVRSLSINSSSSTGLRVNLFKISLHLSTWLDNNSISFSISFCPLNCFTKSWVIILIVERGVPNEWAAAAAWPPKDKSSCYVAITSSIFASASFLKRDWLPNVIAKKFKKIIAIISEAGIA